MACTEWRDEWIAHLYDETSPEERATIDSHLGRCRSCRETMRALGDSRRLLGEFAPAVPAVPRVVVLRPRTAWGNAWGFAAGLAAATLVFFVGTMAASPGAQPPAAAGEFAAQVESIDGRLAALEEAPRPIDAGLASGDPLTREELDQELERASRRFQRERAEDLDYLARWLAASEQRTGAFIDRTQEALTYLAVRGDPGVRER